MRRSFLLLSALIALLLLAGAGPAEAQSRDEREVRALLDRSFQAANSTDPKLSQQNLAEHAAPGGPSSRRLPSASARSPNWRRW